MIENEIVEQLEKLNLKTYELFCKLDRYKDKMTETAYKYMAEKLFLIYKEEFEKLYGEYDIECTRRKYELKERRFALLPRSWRAWWTLFICKRKNKAARLIEEKAEIEAENFFKEIEKQLEQERTAADTTESDDKSEKH